MQPTICPEMRHAGPAKKFTGTSKFWWLRRNGQTERSWSVTTIQAPGTAPVDTNFISNQMSKLIWMPLLGPGPGGCPFRGLRSGTCGTFQLAAEPAEVKPRKFAHAMCSRTCTPCPVWMREPLARGLLLIAPGEPAVSNGWLEKLAWHALSYVCVNKAWPAAGQVLSLPQALHINATSVSGRAGFANFSPSHAKLPSLVRLGCASTNKIFRVFSFRDFAEPSSSSLALSMAARGVKIDADNPRYWPGQSRPRGKLSGPGRTSLLLYASPWDQIRQAPGALATTQNHLHNYQTSHKLAAAVLA
eukprot:1138762-Pelagomonas_calceolata.AAC.1